MAAPDALAVDREPRQPDPSHAQTEKIHAELDDEGRQEADIKKY